MSHVRTSILLKLGGPLQLVVVLVSVDMSDPYVVQDSCVCGYELCCTDSCDVDGHARLVNY